MAESLVKEHVSSKEKIWTRDFILICLANFFVFLGFQMTLPTIPLFVESLGGNDRLIGVVVGIFTFSALLIRPFAGQLLETKGRRFVFLAGLTIFIFTIGVFGFTTSLILLFAIRVIQGIGWGYSTTASGTIATDLIPAKRRGEGMGYYGLSGNVALAIGPSLGLILVNMISFKELFLICGLLGVIAWISASTIRYKKAEPIAIAAKTTKWNLYEKSALQPSILIFFISVTFGGISTFLPLYADQRGVTGIQWYFFIFAAALMTTRIFAGQLYDKHGHKAIYIPSTILISIAMLLLAWMPNNTVLYIAAICYGLGFGALQPALQAWSVEKAAANRKGMANATYFSFFDLGIGFGAILFGQIGYFLDYRSIYITAALSVLLSIVIYIWLLIRNKQT
ncbi:MFS transporter major facilitator superfamily protein [Peribacillus asahii]|uniref:MFS transporter major facilitator superfamily protein n=1 Tax=Peribacillus asahii TaxID=228899 RepID=A0A3Q9RRE4_9BACI|nr:MFS transporter [Peribacillus asahii]AZV44521.1 MFS transporter major facilitator superfamily protein [Peribacillus asahii]